MRSRFADKFNHDEDAPDYDQDVRNERDPIRTGYAAALGWVASRAALEGGERVLELGSGTANLTRLLPAACDLVCVDLSAEMTDVARRKLGGEGWRRLPRFVQQDILQAATELAGPFDAVLSTYTVHHLTGDEKERLFERLGVLLSPGGRAVFADLMFETPAERERLVRAHRGAGRTDLVATIEDEFFWDLERARSELEGLGMTVETERFSELSWGLCAVDPPTR